jgi:hypothetical protein
MSIQPSSFVPLPGHQAENYGGVDVEGCRVMGINLRSISGHGKVSLEIL